jgi:hypothetical protein
MTRALSIPPDAAARMMMLVSHDKRSQQPRSESTRNSSGEATVPTHDTAAEDTDSMGTVAGVRVTKT